MIELVRDSELTPTATYTHSERFTLHQFKFLARTVVLCAISATFCAFAITLYHNASWGEDRADEAPVISATPMELVELDSLDEMVGRSDRFSVTLAMDTALEHELEQDIAWQGVRHSGVVTKEANHESMRSCAHLRVSETGGLEHRYVRLIHCR